MTVDVEISNPEQLAAQAQSGSGDSFSQLVEQLGDRLFNFLCQMGVKPHDAEDLAQETFLRAYRNLHRYNPQYSFISWLFTIGKRLAFNHFRDTKNTCELEEDQFIDTAHPGSMLEEKDAKGSLWDLAKTLKPAQYDALWLRYGEGLTIEETARVMRTNQIRVRVLLHRGRSLMAKKIAWNQAAPEGPRLERHL